jgi:hypothetical protein
MLNVTTNHHQEAEMDGAYDTHKGNKHTQIFGQKTWMKETSWEG